MQERRALSFGLLLTAVLAAVSLLAWPHIPDGAPVAVHFDAEGHANGFWPRPAALAFGPALVLGLTLLFAATRGLRFAGDEEGGSRRAFDRIGLAALAVVGTAHVLILLHAEGKVPDMGAMLVPPLALLLMVAGNLMGKLRRNAVMGIRTPWSLASAYAWEKSNRAGGRLLVALGVLVLLADALLTAAQALRLLVAGSLILTATVIFLSWHYWRHDPTRNRSGPP